jgi:hypothetical protein
MSSMTKIRDGPEFCEESRLDLNLKHLGKSDK